jgi:hypothetical protein
MRRRDQVSGFEYLNASTSSQGKALKSPHHAAVLSIPAVAMQQQAHSLFCPFASYVPVVRHKINKNIEV